MEAFIGTAPYTASVPPQRHFMRGLGWMREVGLEDRAARTFAATFSGPLGDELEDSLACALAMLFDGVEAEVSPEDWADYRRLAGRDSADFIGRQPDYAGFAAYTMLVGTRRRRG
jgi:hypothetical protein